MKMGSPIHVSIYSISTSGTLKEQLFLNFTSFLPMFLYTNKTCFYFLPSFIIGSVLCFLFYTVFFHLAT